VGRLEKSPKIETRVNLTNISNPNVRRHQTEVGGQDQKKKGHTITSHGHRHTKKCQRRHSNCQCHHKQIREGQGHMKVQHH